MYFLERTGFYFRLGSSRDLLVRLKPLAPIHSSARARLIRRRSRRRARIYHPNEWRKISLRPTKLPCTIDEYKPRPGYLFRLNRYTCTSKGANQSVKRPFFISTLRGISKSTSPCSSASGSPLNSTSSVECVRLQASRNSWLPVSRRQNSIPSPFTCTGNFELVSSNAG